MKRDRGNREWLDEYMSLKQVNPEYPFTAPEGYFDSLTGQIMSKIKLGEMKGDMPSAGFSVPENYFDELANNITARINIEQSSDKEAAGFTVPDGYFDELSANIHRALILKRLWIKKPMDLPYRMVILMSYQIK